MKNKIFIAGLLFVNLMMCFLNYNFGQNLSVKNRLNIKTGFAIYKPLQNKNINYRLELNYGVSNLIECGAYIGYSNFDMIFRNENPTDSFSLYLIKKNPTLFVGLNCNFNFLPLFIKSSDFRFDLYATTKIGGQFGLINSNNLFEGGYKEYYALGGGLAFYPWRHVGFFAEYTLGKFYYSDNKKLRFGFSLKF